jgi:ABC-type dipeptide/oligopeptide/nickel transport system permease subunit
VANVLLHPVLLGANKYGSDARSERIFASPPTVVVVVLAVAVAVVLFRLIGVSTIMS